MTEEDEIQKLREEVLYLKSRIENFEEQSSSACACNVAEIDLHMLRNAIRVTGIIDSYDDYPKMQLPFWATLNNHIMHNITYLEDKVGRDLEELHLSIRGDLEEIQKYSSGKEEQIQKEIRIIRLSCSMFFMFSTLLFCILFWVIFMK